MSSALIGLLGAVIGGALVLLGDSIARRAEWKAKRLEDLRLATADVIASYLKARSRLIARDGGDNAIGVSDVWPDERQLALARLFTLPGSEVLRPNVLAIGNITLQIYGENDPVVRQRHYEDQLSAIRELEGQVRRMLRA